MINAWRAEPEWKGQTGFIIGGGPSLLQQNLDLLRNQHVITINTSFKKIPWAEFTIFADTRWFLHHQKDLRNFKGRIVSVSTAATGPPVLLKMHRKNPPKLADDRGTLMVQNTTLTAAMNLAVHLGVSKIVLLGIDQKPGPDGKTHHHEPHPWKTVADCWKKQQVDLVHVATQLKERGIECVNASPGSALGLWPIVNLEEMFAEELQVA